MNISRFSLVIAVAVALTSSAAHAQFGFVTIDDYNVAQSGSVVSGNFQGVAPVTGASTSLLGTQREFFLDSSAPGPGSQVSVAGGTGQLIYNIDAGTGPMSGQVIYDGAGGTGGLNGALDPNRITAGFLPSKVDLTAGLGHAFELTIDSYTGPVGAVGLEILVYSGTNNALVSSSGVFTVPSLTNSTVWHVEFSDFDGGSPAFAFTNVGAIVLQITNLSNLATPVTLVLGNSVTGGFQAVPEASPMWMLLGAAVVFGSGRYGWKKYKTRRALAA